MNLTPPSASLLDIVIPVYDEAENIISVLDELTRHVRTPHHIYISYDDDEDTTLPAVRTWTQNHPSGRVSLVRNRGTGVHAAVLTGFSAGSAPAALVFPADDNYNAGIVDDLYAHFLAGNDIVAASRFMPGGIMHGCPWLKALLVRLAAVSLHRLAGVPTHDPTSGLRLFSRRLLDAVTIESRHGFTYSLELLVKCHRIGWRVSEVPARWFERTKGRSRFRILRWLPAYLRWYFYAFATAWGGRDP